MIDPKYEGKFELLGGLCRTYLDELENGDPDQMTLLLLCGVMVAAHADIYNMAPRAGLFDVGAMFTGSDGDSFPGAFET